MSPLALSLVMLAALQALPSHAANTEDSILKELRKAHPSTQFDSVVRTPLRGLYAVWMGKNLAFVAPGDTRHIVFGRMLDTTTLRDLHAAGPAVAPAGVAGSPTSLAPQVAAGPGAQRFSDLPLADAIKRVNGSGARTLAVFTDPACPYCKQLEASLDALADVTIYLFMVPFQGRELPRAVWCAADRMAAWRAAVGAAAGPSGLAPAPACADPLDRNLALASAWHIKGTPTLVFADGSRLESYAGASEIDSRLAAQPVKDKQP